jgi:S-adenosylmethionine/arginine decarboxylase-like enzyme
MPTVDALAYGMHLVYDGVHADPSRLADRSLIERIVLDVAAILRAPDAATSVIMVEEGSGASAGVHLTEAAVTLHAFPGLGAICLDVFSVQRRQADALYRPVEEAFAIGRSSSRRANRARAPRPDQTDDLPRRLRGERAFAEARFTNLDTLR